MARIMTSAGFAGTLGGTAFVFGTAEQQVISLADVKGRVTFDPSFNKGGDIIVLPKNASAYTALRSGSSVILSDGDTEILLPVGVQSTKLQFADGDRDLLFNSGILIGAQTIGASAATLNVQASGKADLPNDKSTQAARVIVSNETVTLGGTYQVYGSSASERVIIVDRPGTITFDASFNKGGDSVELAGTVDAFSVKRVGSSAVFASQTQTISLPTGLTANLVQFADDARLVLFDPKANALKLGDVTVSGEATRLALAAAGRDFVGTSGDDYIDGAKLNLIKGPGNISGGAGNDTIILPMDIGATASAGNDTYIGVWAFNTLRYWSLEEAVNINVAEGTVTTKSGKLDRISGIDYFWGTNFDDVMQGGSYPAVFNPQNGNDLIIGGSAGDTVAYLQPSTAFTVTYDQATDTFTVKDNQTFSGTDTLKNVFRVTFGDDVTYFGRLSNFSWSDYQREFNYAKKLSYGNLDVDINVDKLWFQSLTIPRSAFSTQLDYMALENTLNPITGYGSYIKVSETKQLVYYSGWYHAKPSSGSLFIIEYENGVVSSKKDYRIEGATHSWPVQLADGSTVIVFTGVDEGKLSEKKSATAPVYIYDVDDATLTTTSIRAASHNNLSYDFDGDGLLDIVSQNFAGYEDTENSDGRPFVLINNGDGTFSKQKWATDPAQAVYGTQTLFGGMAVTPLGKQADGTFAVVMLDSLGYEAFNLKPRSTYIFYFSEDMKTVVRAEKLPDPFFEKPEYASVRQVQADWLTGPIGISHDVNVRAVDLDYDGRLDLVIQSQLWSPEQSLGAIQILMNRATGWVDETESRIFGFNMMAPGSGHWSNFIDVNGDGFDDLITMDPTTFGLDINRNGQADYRVRTPGSDFDIDLALNLSPGTKVLLNDGTGHFVVAIDYQIPWSQTEILPTFLTSLDEFGRLRFTGIQSDPTYRSDKLAYITTRTLDYVLSTGPNGRNPAEYGAPGFNEFYYLLNNKDVQAALTNGSIASGLEHYLSIGKAEGRFAFAPNAWVQGSIGADNITLREGNERGIGGAGNDVIDGRAGDDRLYGGAGNDILTGGLGRDVFVFDTELGMASVDRVTDFSLSEDKIELSKAVFKGLADSVKPDQFLAGLGLKDAKTAEHRLVYDTQSGALYYDADGAGTDFAAIQIAIFEGAPILTSGMFVLG